MLDPTKLKEGDKVVVIKDHEGLIKGDIYTVTFNSRWGDGQPITKEGLGWFLSHKDVIPVFKLLERKSHYPIWW